jgi:hypothetical protein
VGALPLALNDMSDMPMCFVLQLSGVVGVRQQTNNVTKQTHPIARPEVTITRTIALRKKKTYLICLKPY